MGISVEFNHHEAAQGQNEIDLRYADALSTADNIMTFRAVIKEVALEQGIFASFMPKPFAEHPARTPHPPLAVRGRHERLPRAGRAASKTGRRFIAGLLHHGAEITAVTVKPALGRRRDPRPTSPGAQQPLGRGRCRCTSRPRASSSRVGAQPGQRLQPLPLLRGAAAAAGSQGIEEGYDLPPETEDDVWSLTYFSSARRWH